MHGARHIHCAQLHGIYSAVHGPKFQQVYHISECICIHLLDLNHPLHRYAKKVKGTDWTQLQFEFVSVPVSDSFPFGSKMTYRKYTQDEVILIEQCDDESTFGFRVRNAQVTVQPEAVGEHVPEGMFLLKALPPPDRELTPDAFIQGSRAELEKVVNACIRTFSLHRPTDVAQWIRFRDEIAPQDDSAERYMAEKGMEIPFKAELFSGGGLPAEEIVQRGPRSLADRETVRFTGSVQWSGRGRGLQNVAPEPYITIDPTSVGPTAEPAPQAQRRQRSNAAAAAPAPPSSDEASSDEEPGYQYIDLDPSFGPEADFFKYVGRKFKDDVDGGTFEVVAVCDMRRIGARRSTNVVYAFKYFDIDGDADEFDYTPCREMLNSYWCKWISMSTRSNRAGREVSSEQPQSSRRAAPTESLSLNKRRR